MKYQAIERMMILCFFYIFKFYYENNDIIHIIRLRTFSNILIRNNFAKMTIEH